MYVNATLTALYSCIKHCANKLQMNISLIAKSINILYKEINLKLPLKIEPLFHLVMINVHSTR